MFNPDIIHVGISCGCHAEDSEMCCFMYATEPEDTKSWNKLEVILEDRFACPNTADWKYTIKGEAYDDPDAPEPPPPSYQEISHGIYTSYSALLQASSTWASDQDDATKAAVGEFSQGLTISESSQLTAIAARFLAEAAPCSSYKNKAGESMIINFINQIDTYEKAHLMSYIGVYTDNPKDIIKDQLNLKRFDPDQFKGEFDEMGAACDCNGNQGMQCLMIFTKSAKFKQVDDAPASFNDV